MDWPRISRIAGFIAFAAALVLFAIRLRSILLPFFLALLFAYVIQPAIRGFEKLEVNTGAAIAVTYAYFFAFSAVVISLCLPIIISQFRSLFSLLPQLLQQTGGYLEQAAALSGSSLLQGIWERLSVFVQQVISERLAAAVEDTAAVVAALLRILLYSVLIPFLAYYILHDKGAARRRILSWLPAGERVELERLAADIDNLLRQFLRGYLLVATAVAILSAAFYWSIGLADPLALGFIMGLADLIPYLGPLIGSIPALIVALTEGVGKTVLTAGGIIVIQQLESLVLTPKVMGDKVGLHPLTTVFAVMAGGWLFGLLGAILAVPSTAAGLRLLQYLWNRIVGAKFVQ